MEESMSAVAWEPGFVDGTGLGYAGAPALRRSRLVALPGGGQAGSAAAAGLRITRRGRVAMLALVLALATVLGTVGLRGAGAAQPLPTVTVGSGQTLSEVAATELPGLSISEGVLAIQLANGLSTAQVRAGQQLVIPRG
jgi:LysM repeat protein